MSIYLTVLLISAYASASNDSANTVNASKQECQIEAPFDAYFNKCIIPPNGRCNPFSDDEPQCPLYSECQYEWENSRCKCRNHFSIGEDGRSCVLGELLGGPCNPEKEADANGCDTFPGLQCVRDKTPGKEDTGKCGCGDLMFWNNITESCMVKNCRQRMPNAFEDEKTGNCIMALWKEFKPSDLSSRLVSCPAGAVSKPNLPSRTLYFCTCAKGYQTNKDKNACIRLKTFGQACQSPVLDEICDDKDLLNCIDGTCQCNQDQPGGWNSRIKTCTNDAYCGTIAKNLFYDTEAQECFGTIGKPVKVYNQPNGILLCPKNSKSYFYPDNSQMSEDVAMCVCERQFKPSPDARSCVAFQ